MAKENRALLAVQGSSKNKDMKIKSLENILQLILFII